MISKSNHVTFARLALFAVSAEAKKNTFLCFAQCKINQLLDSVFVINIQDNQGLGKGYKPQPLALADNPYLDLDYTGYHKNLIQ